MSLVSGLIITFGIIVLGGVSITGFLLWLRYRESDELNQQNHDGVSHV